jgi:hypothetical protein
MTLPGAETMNEGIMGDDCFRCIGGGAFCEEEPFGGGSSTGDMAATGEDSGVCVDCDAVEGDLRLSIEALSAVDRVIDKEMLEQEHSGLPGEA